MMDEPSDDLQFWLNEIKTYENEFKQWESRAEKIVKRYRDERTNPSSEDTARFNILWSNVQTLIPAVFAKLPKADVSRRFSDKDPVGRVASLILQRAIEFELDHYSDYRSSMKSALEDRFLGGRGTVWVRYEPHTRKQETRQFGTLSREADDGLQITEDQEGEALEEIEYECSPTDYVYWKDFGHTLARTWEEVRGVWRRVYMTRDALVERFGDDVARTIPFDSQQEGLSEKNEKSNRACIYEIWDKEKKKALWLSKSTSEFLDVKDDPLGLEEFFPCPKPLYATTTNDNLKPVPDFVLYQDQARELDTICERIDGLVKALKVSGVYNASIPALSRLFTEGGNTELIPVDQWSLFAEKGGIKGAIDFVPLEMVASALRSLYEAREQIKQTIYEITGISDIIRGQTQASETATAQNIKGQYAGLRLSKMRDEVAQFAADIIKIKAQIMCTNYQPQTLISLSAAEQLSEEDKQYVMPALELLKNKPLRNFRVEVESDSLVLADEQAEKQSRVEFLSAAGAFLEKAVQAANVAPDIVPLLGELLMFGIRGFKVGRTIEGVFDTFLENFEKQQKVKMMQPPQPDPRMIAEQAKAQIAQTKAQAEAMRSQADMHVANVEGQAAVMKAQADMRKATMQSPMDAA